LVKGTILIHRAKVLTQTKDRTKTMVEREVELNSRSKAVIQRQKIRTHQKSPYVFLNPETGAPWNDDQVQRRRWTKVLLELGIRHRPPKELRDTSVTLALSAGANPVWVAKQHGHSLQVMMKDYAKWIHGADQGRNISTLDAHLK